MNAPDPAHVPAETVAARLGVHIETVVAITRDDPRLPVQPGSRFTAADLERVWPGRGWAA